jgi:hypothetical protein
MADPSEVENKTLTGKVMFPWSTLKVKNPVPPPSSKSYVTGSNPIVATSIENDHENLSPPVVIVQKNCRVDTNVLVLIT